MNEQDAPRCENCYYLTTREERGPKTLPTHTIMMCHRYPPQIAGGGDSAIDNCFPETHSTDPSWGLQSWCGEWRSRDNPEQTLRDWWQREKA
jgi:hypothetical protein